MYVRREVYLLICRIFGPKGSFDLTESSFQLHGN